MPDGPNRAAAESDVRLRAQADVRRRSRNAIRRAVHRRGFEHTLDTLAHVVAAEIRGEEDVTNDRDDDELRQDAAAAEVVLLDALAWFARSRGWAPPR